MPPDPDLPPETVFAVDDVPLELPIARLGSRVLAATVDYLVLGCVALVLAVAVLALGVALDLRAGWILALEILGLFLLEHGYFIGQEVLLHGQTLGKRLFRLQVVAADGAGASVSSLVVRNLLRSLDLLVGVVLMGVDPLARRIGDRLAGTRVVHEAHLEIASVRVEAPSDWAADEVRLVEAFLARSDELDPGTRTLLARRLETWVERRSPGLLPPTDATDDPEVRLRSAFLSGTA